MMRQPIKGIYAILPADLAMDDLMFRAEAALKGGVKTLQFRDKKQGFKRALKKAQQLKVLTSRYDAKLIVNDSLSLAQACDADGVHLGKSDIDNLQNLRQQAGNMLLGITCRADAMFGQEALRAGANYLSFGAVYASTSKPEVPVIGLARLSKARSMFAEANLCAIGGITLQNMATVKASGVDCVAVISALFAQQDIEATARAMCESWQQA